ncbi:MAG: XRE family transcriptional regulator, partial [Pseudomonadota bacterium]
RLESICDLAGTSLTELATTLRSDRPLLSQLSAEQERELIGDPKLLLMAYLLVNAWRVDEIVRRFEIDEPEAKARLRRLRDLGFIELLPFDRVRVLTARNFRWRPDGPVQRVFIEQVQRDFFDAPFVGEDAALYLLGGLLSEASRRTLVGRMEQLAIEIDELSRRDARLPREQRQACGAIVALREWDFELFARLRRPDGHL